MASSANGYTQAELDGAQERYGVCFPPDLNDLLLDRRLDDENYGYSWNAEDPHIRKMLAWPQDCLLFDVEHGSWWQDWGERPATLAERKEVVMHAMAQAPRLIPVYSHRFISETPGLAGNPVFSMYGFDTIYYGTNLENYLEHEFGDPLPILPDRIANRIPFWSDLVEHPEKSLFLGQ